MEHRFAPAAVELGGLISEETFDVRVTAIRVRAARYRVRLEPGRGISGGPREVVQDVAILLVRHALEERGALERTKLQLDPDGLEIVQHRFAPRTDLKVAEELAGVEAVGVSRLGEQ